MLCPCHRKRKGRSVALLESSLSGHSSDSLALPVAVLVYEWGSVLTCGCTVPFAEAARALGPNAQEREHHMCAQAFVSVKQAVAVETPCRPATYLPCIHGPYQTVFIETPHSLRFVSSVVD